MTEMHEKMAAALFEAVGAGESLYAILDGARVPDLPLRLRAAGVAHESLFRGRKEEAMWYIAPHLVRCDQGSVFVRSVIEPGWGESWGIFLASPAELKDLWEHFQQLLVAKTEHQREVYFRFYDPRVLRAFLPTCTLEESRQLFGPVSRYLMEATQPGVLLSFTLGTQGEK